MRSSFLAFAVLAIVAAGAFGSSAFNYAALQPRSVIANIVTDDNGYLAIAAYDAQYACYVAYTNGKIDVTWDGGSSCTAGATGTGVNPYSTYYFHDVLTITNKGTKTLAHLWLNMSDTVIMMNKNTAAATMTTSDTYDDQWQLSTASDLQPGDVWYIGFKIEAATLHTGNSPISKTLTIEARSSA